MNPKYPIYVVSRKRWDSRLTSKALERMGVPYCIVIEKDEYAQYSAVIDPKKILTVPREYHASYDTCDALGETKSQGPGPARNFAWEDSIKKGFAWHWVMDDNISHFFRNHRNKYIEVNDGTIFRVMEDFTERYKNVAMSGPNYFMFVPHKAKHPPFTVNTRIYSCNFIRNDIPFRWRARYNEDTDLSLRILKKGWATIQFNAFTQLKAPTQTVKGGNLDEFYKREGTLPKTKMQILLHPDVSRMTWKFGRWHHEIDYSRFKNNPLVPKEGIELKGGIDNYGMVLVDTLKKSDKM